MDELIKSGVIQPIKKKKTDEDNVSKEDLMKKVTMDSEGHLRDENDRIIKLEKFKTSKYNSI